MRLAVNELALAVYGGASPSATTIPVSFNGRTLAFEASYCGSNPHTGAKMESVRLDEEAAR